MILFPPSPGVPPGVFPAGRVAGGAFVAFVRFLEISMNTNLSWFDRFLIRLALVTAVSRGHVADERTADHLKKALVRVKSAA